MDIQIQVKDTIDKKFLNENNTLEIISSENYMKVLKESQTKIIKIDRDYIQKFVKIAGYLKSTEKNIFNIFKRILYDTFSPKAKTIDLKEFIEEGRLAHVILAIKHVNKITGCGLKESRSLILKNKSLIERDGAVNHFYPNDYGLVLEDLNQHIISYQGLVISSFKMIKSLDEDDMITFYEMYEVFDKLGIFDTQWQKSMLEKLGDLTSTVDDVSKSLKNVNSTIKNGLDNLSEDLLDVSKVILKGLDTISSDIQYQSEELSSGLDTISSDIQNQND